MDGVIIFVEMMIIVIEMVVSIVVLKNNYDCLVLYVFIDVYQILINHSAMQIMKFDYLLD